MQVKTIEVLGQGDVTITFPDHMRMDDAISYLIIFFNNDLTYSMKGTFLGYEEDDSNGN